MTSFRKRWAFLWLTVTFNFPMEVNRRSKLSKASQNFNTRWHWELLESSSFSSNSLEKWYISVEHRRRSKLSSKDTKAIRRFGLTRQNKSTVNLYELEKQEWRTFSKIRSCSVDEMIVKLNFHFIYDSLDFNTQKCMMYLIGTVIALQLSSWPDEMWYYIINTVSGRSRFHVM